MSSEQPKEYIITEFQLKQLQNFASLEFVCQAIRSRPHISTEEEICKRCLCTSPCQPWFDEHDATIRNATLDEIHARYVDAYLNPDNYNEINAKEVYQFIESLRSKGGEQ